MDTATMHRRNRWLSTCLLAAVLAGCSMQATPTCDCTGVGAYSDGPLKSLMAKYVQDGQVDYRGLKKSPECLDRAMKILACTGPTRTPTAFADDRAKLAYWINAYNTLGVWAGWVAWPASSAQPLWGDFDESVAATVDGRTMTLAQIRAAAIQLAGRDLRVKLALAEPAKGCGSTLGTVYDGKNLDRQLAERFASAIRDTKILEVDHERRTVWIGRDLDADAGEYVARYRQAVGAEAGTLVNAIVWQTDDATLRRRLNEAVGYTIDVRPFDTALNVWDRFECSAAR